MIEDETQSGITRRDFLHMVLFSSGGAGLVLAGLGLDSLIRPTRAQAQAEWIYSARPAWKTRNWWPIFETTAIKDNLPRLFDQWWPLDMIDVLNGHETKTGPLYKWGQTEAGNIQDKYQNDQIQIESAGWCLPTAAIISLEPEPTWAPKQVGPYSLGRSLIEGMMVAKHAGDYFINVDSSPDTLAKLLQQGVPVVVDLPERPGKWYRALNGVNIGNNSVLVTNYGFGDKPLNANGIVGAWAVYHVLPPEYLAQLDPKIKAEADARAIPGLTDNLVDPFIYP